VPDPLFRGTISHHPWRICLPLLLLQPLDHLLGPLLCCPFLVIARLGPRLRDLPGKFPAERGLGKCSGIVQKIGAAEIWIRRAVATIFVVAGGYYIIIIYGTGIF